MLGFQKKLVVCPRLFRAIVPRRTQGTCPLLNTNFARSRLFFVISPQAKCPSLLPFREMPGTARQSLSLAQCIYSCTCVPSSTTRFGGMR